MLEIKRQNFATIDVDKAITILDNLAAGSRGPSQAKSDDDHDDNDRLAAQLLERGELPLLHLLKLFAFRRDQLNT